MVTLVAWALYWHYCGSTTSLTTFMDKLWLTGRALGQVYSFRSGCMHTMHLLPGVAIQPNLELKTRPKPVLGSLPLAFALPATLLVGEGWHYIILPKSLLVKFHSANTLMVMSVGQIVRIGNITIIWGDVGKLGEGMFDQLTFDQMTLCQIGLLFLIIHIEHNRPIDSHHGS